MSDVDKSEAVEWLIGQAAQVTGVPSHRLRHYDRVGLLPPSRVGANGRRYYDGATFLRLQRILFLRETGLGLPEIAGALEEQGNDVSALEEHLQWLRAEQDRIATQIGSVQATLAALQAGEPVPATTMFEGFTPTQRQQEAPKEPEAGPYAEIDQWWSLLDEAAQQAYQQEEAGIQAAFGELIRAHQDAAGAQAQAVTQKLYDWLGVEAQDRRPSAEEVLEVGERYVAELRFTAGYTPDSEESARFIRDALGVYVQHCLK